MDKFLEKYNFLRLSQEEIKKLNRLITSFDVESVIKKLQVSRRKKIKIRAEINEIETKKQ